MGWRGLGSLQSLDSLGSLGRLRSPGSLGSRQSLEMATLLMMEVSCAVGLFIVMDVVRELGRGRGFSLMVCDRLRFDAGLIAFGTAVVNMFLDDVDNPSSPVHVVSVTKSAKQP